MSEEDYGLQNNTFQRAITAGVVGALISGANKSVQLLSFPENIKVMGKDLSAPVVVGSACVVAGLASDVLMETVFPVIAPSDKWQTRSAWMLYTASAGAVGCATLQIMNNNFASKVGLGKCFAITAGSVLVADYVYNNILQPWME